MKRILLIIGALFSLTTGAHALDISDYTAYPPFLPRTTSPNILFMIDYSAEMITPAYGTCTYYIDTPGSGDPASDCRYNYSFLTYDYSSASTYEGYFDVDTTTPAQKYSYGVIDTVGGGQNNNGFSKSATGTWSANFLNWLSMTQFDIVKKVVVGGDVTPAPESARPNKMKSSQYEDRWERKAINLPGDTAAGASWNVCSSADTPDCVKFPALTYNWIGTTGATTIWSNDGTTPSYDNDVRGPYDLPFPFAFYGTLYTKVCISTNGVVGLTNQATCDAALTTFTNPDMPSATTPNNIIAPYWDDLLVLGTATTPSSVKTFTTTIGTAAAPYNQQPYDIPYMSQSTSKIFVISYENVLAFADTGKADYMSFQILLYEGSNHIVFQYKDVRSTKPLLSFSGGKSATIGVENSDGTIAKRFSYNGSTLIADGSAVFASPVLTYGIRTTSSGTKAPSFFPAYPLGLALSGTCPATGPCSTSASVGPYDINIKINYTATPCGSGYYYNSDRNECYDHKIKGLIQDLRDSEASGGLGFRIAVMKVAGTEGGTVTKHFNDTGGWTNSLGALRDQGPSTGSPLSEALYDAQGYFREDTNYRIAAGDWTYDNPATVACAATGTNFDPYCFKSAAQRVSCCKSFVLIIGAGNYTYDFRTNIYSDILEASGSGPTPAQAGGYRTVPGETVGQEGTRANGGWLDNVAYKSHTTDLRSDIAGTQNLTIYAVNTFGSISTDLTAAILAADTTIPVASTTGFPSAGRIQIDDEVISYTGKTSTSFTGCTRGVDLTTAAGHTSGKEVYKSPGLAQTTLSVAALSTDTTITVTSTSGFTPTGKIQVNSEIISYTGKTATSFTGCTRGVDMTTAAGHLLGAIVYQEVPAVNGTEVLKGAATYGGFEDSNGNNAYDAGEDDKNNNGVPDTYFEASEGSNIKSKITDAVAAILRSSASGTSVSVLSTSAGGEGAIYQAYFYPAKVETQTEDRDWPGYMRAFFIDKYQNLRDDYSGGAASDAKLVIKDSDRIAQMCLNTTTNEVKIKLFADLNGDGKTDTTPDTSCPGTDINTTMDDVISIFEAGKKLALRTKSDRNIYTWLNDGGAGGTTTGAFSSSAGTPKDFVSTGTTPADLQKYLRAGDPDGLGPLTAVDEATNIINFIRGNVVSGYRNRCISVSGSTSDETGCANTDSLTAQRSWALGDIVYSTPTLVGGPGEKYDEIYSESSYIPFKKKYKDRRRVIYVGANDGMLHAFNGGVYLAGDDPSTTSVVESGRFEANSSLTLNGFTNGWTTPIPIPGLGDELWAFIPHDNLPHLAWLACNGTSTDPTACGVSEYTHVFYVDQRAKATDVRIFSNTATADCPGAGPSGGISGQGGVCHPNGWGSILIVGMRLGGGAMDVDINGDASIGAGEQFRSAFYAFDITDPEAKPKLLWRFYNADLGFTNSYPAIARIKIATDTDEKWYMVVGSGPKNTTTSRDYGDAGKAQALKVFVVDIADGSLKQTLDMETTAVYTSMGDPIVVDVDLVDFMSDVIYIGGTVTTSTTATGGKVYRINTNKTHPSNTPGAGWKKSTLIDTGKPVLVTPSVSKDANNNLWVFFGTGRLRNSNDITNYEQQTFYGIKDACWKNLNSTSPDTCDTLSTTDYAYTSSQLANTTGSAVAISTGAVTGVTPPTVCTTCGTLSGLASYMRSTSGVKGWYANLSAPASPATTPASERVLSRAAVLGGLVIFTTYKPAGDICSIFGDSRLYALYYETGTAYNKAIIGTSDTGISTTTSSTGTNVSKALELGKGMPTAVGIAVGEKVTGFVQKSTGEIVRIESEPGTSVKSGAASWREKTGGGGTSEIETIYKHIVR